MIHLGLLDEDGLYLRTPAIVIVVIVFSILVFMSTEKEKGECGQDVLLVDLIWEGIVFWVWGLFLFFLSLLLMDFT